LKIDLAIIDKRRYADDEKARAENLIGNVSGRTAFIFDDEIASGGTILEAARFLRSAGASRVIAGATHGVFTRDASSQLQASVLERVIVTDTIPTPIEKRFEKLTCLTVAPLFANAIAAIYEGRSISALF
jgi:ribose-phosphate pyrophosphokinase